MATGQAPRTTASPAPPIRSGLLRLPRIRQAERADWTQLVRFCVVGASGYVVNLAVFAVVLKAFGAHHIVAAVAAFCVAWLNNFALNRNWTFRGRAGSALGQGARYLAVSVASLGLNVVMLEALVRGGLAEISAQALAIALVTPVVFLLNRRWAFR
ncbi:MAG TPA: GtrA family protein [Miltoncostaeaceae bacterium]|nr:GtrA family protein [Miltoncostaeaceae bacterium]